MLTMTGGLDAISSDASAMALASACQIALKYPIVKSSGCPSHTRQPAVRRQGERLLAGCAELHDCQRNDNRCIRQSRELRGIEQIGADGLDAPALQARLFAGIAKARHADDTSARLRPLGSP